MAKYDSVNGQWPEGTGDGRDIKPTPQEALAGAKRLYRVAMKRPWGKRPIKLTSGRRDTRIRRGVLYVNPDWRGGGWHEIVHSISHHAAWRLYNESHGPRHAWIERELIQYVVKNGWLDGKLKREPPPPKPKPSKLSRVEASIKRWQSKAKRAQTALRKLERQRKYYERQQAA